MKTLVNFILDKSASMESVKPATISGFNEYIRTLKKDGNEYEFSLTLFNTEVEKRYVKVPLQDVDSSVINSDNYRPDGMTALYDAVCQTIEVVRKNLAEDTKVLTVIMTDGEENSSKEYTQESFRNKIKELEKTERWTFVYLGANQDAWANAQKYGFSKMNVSGYQSTDRGVKAAFSSMAQNTSNFAASAQANTSNFMSEKDQDELENTK